MKRANSSGKDERSEFLTGEEQNKGSYQSGQMGQTVNLLAYAFGGSNPSLPTKKVPVGVARFPVAPACGHRGWRGLTLIRYIFAEVAQLIEHQPSKLRVASLSLVFRSTCAAACDANASVGWTGSLRRPLVLRNEFY